VCRASPWLDDPSGEKGTQGFYFQETPGALEDACGRIQQEAVVMSSQFFHYGTGAGMPAQRDLQ
jgi:hypothetical protein